MNIKLLKGKKVYLAPYNNLTFGLKELFEKSGLDVSGFFDKEKKGSDIFNHKEVSDYDYVVIASPRYWKQISINFSPDKVLIFQQAGNSLSCLDDYEERLVKSGDFDVLLLPFNKSNAHDLSMVSRELTQLGITSVLVDTYGGCNTNLYQGLIENNDVQHISKFYLENVTNKAIVASIDWEGSFGREYIKQQRSLGIKTIGLVDGIEDFDDADYSYDRKAYQTVEYVLTMGKDDQLALKNKIEKTTVVGLPKLFPLMQETIVFPTNPKIVINVNFTYGTYEEERDHWVAGVIQACNELNIPYVIAQHHADKGNLSQYNISEFSAYDAIRRGSLLVSRFSTLILESLALGKPAVYFNPHGEKVSIYKEPLGAFSVATNIEQLKRKIIHELANKEGVRARAYDFLEKKCFISSTIPPAKLAAYRIKNIIEEGEGVSLKSGKLYCIKENYVSRNEYCHYDDSNCEDEWQLEVYLHALGLMVSNQFNRIADFGCGSGFKLVKYLGQFNTTGYELPVNVNILNNKYPERNWKVSDFEQENDIDVDVLICSDVIEHVLDPDELLNYFKKQSFEFLILSTPERDLCYPNGSPFLLGPPRNKAHQREWNFKEFFDYISSSFEVLDHRVTNLKQATQMIICKKLQQ